MTNCRNVKQSLLSEVANEFNATQSDVIAKFHALRTQFNREMSREKKAKSGAGSDEIYISKWEYKSSLQFLQVGTITGQTVSNLDDSNCESSSSSDCGSITVKTDSSDTHSEYEGTANNNNKRPFQQVTQKNAKKRAYQASTSDEDVLMEQAISVINQKNDEYDIFGQFVANEMRQIENVSTRKKMKHEIMRIMMNIDGQIHSSDS